MIKDDFGYSRLVVLGLIVASVAFVFDCPQAAAAPSSKISKSSVKQIKRHIKRAKKFVEKSNRRLAASVEQMAAPVRAQESAVYLQLISHLNLTYQNAYQDGFEFPEVEQLAIGLFGTPPGAAMQAQREALALSQAEVEQILEYLDILGYTAEQAQAIVEDIVEGDLGILNELLENLDGTQEAFDAAFEFAQLLVSEYEDRAEELLAFQQELLSQLSTIEDQIEVLETTVDALESEIANIEFAIENLNPLDPDYDRLLAELTAQLNGYQSELTGALSDLETYQNQFEALQEQYNQADIERQMRSSISSFLRPFIAAIDSFTGGLVSKVTNFVNEVRNLVTNFINNGIEGLLNQLLGPFGEISELLSSYREIMALIDGIENLSPAMLFEHLAGPLRPLVNSGTYSNIRNGADRVADAIDRMRNILLNCRNNPLNCLPPGGLRAQMARHSAAPARQRLSKRALKRIDKRIVRSVRKSAVSLRKNGDSVMQRYIELHAANGQSMQAVMSQTSQSLAIIAQNMN